MFLQRIMDSIKRFFTSAPHAHEWTLVSKTYAAPLQKVLQEMANDTELFQKVLFGVTSFLWSCSCGEIKKDTLLGSDSDTLNDILNKVDLEGPQKVERGGDVYLIGKQPEQSVIPVR